MDWFGSSLMAKRGMAQGRSGSVHRLDERAQGSYHYVYGPYAEPVLTVRPGDSVEVETRDAFEGKIRSEQDLPTRVLTLPYVNPQNGPIRIEGAEKGDTLAVRIDRISPRGPQPRGTTCLIPEFGGLVGTTATAMLNAPLPEIVRKVEVDEATGVRWNERITLPYQPFIGTIGVSPEIEAISSLVPDYYGGNMDLPDMGSGAIAYFPVRRDGALLYVGDCHATQGDGELCGVAIEMHATVRLTVDVIKGWPIGWPRLETAELVMAIGSGRPMEDAARIAYRELIRWMQADWGWDPLEAYLFLTQAGRVRLGNMVDPKYTLGASVLKRYLAA
jgi:amidase